MDHLPRHPGQLLKDRLDAIHVSPTELGRQIDVPANRITEIIHGVRSISAETAVLLAHWFGTSAEFWINLQAAYDLRLAHDALRSKLQELGTLGDMISSTALTSTAGGDLARRQISEHIQNCSDLRCAATRRLRRLGARLILGMGRHCEIAVLAAAGVRGLLDEELVIGRRAYAEHLGVTLRGPIQDANTAVHARHAADGHVTGAPGARQPINLGGPTGARVIRKPSPDGEHLDRYLLEFPADN